MGYGFALSRAISGLEGKRGKRHGLCGAACYGESKFMNS
jgi:hypothetical protein